MKVIFAPDWREGNRYQQLLADGLAERGVEVKFLSGYSRGLPLTRGLAASRADILHIHWPEAYFPETTQALHRWFREWRYPVDLRTACKGRALVATAHNLLPHWGMGRFTYRQNMAATYRGAELVIAHSKAAAVAVETTFGVASDRIRVLPHGDLATGEDLPGREESRSVLGIPQGQRLVLMFGAASSYKGIEEVLGWWRAHDPAAVLVVAGKAESPAYASHLVSLSGGHPRIRLHLDRFLGDGELNQWLAAADSCLFNYRGILTSGSAIHARALGVPILFPERLNFVDLGEPDPRVIRYSSFDDSFSGALNRAFSITPDHAAAAVFREEIRWETIALAHLAVYREALTSFSEAV